MARSNMSPRSGRSTRPGSRPARATDAVRSSVGPSFIAELDAQMRHAEAARRRVAIAVGVLALIVTAVPVFAFVRAADARGDSQGAVQRVSSEVTNAPVNLLPTSGVEPTATASAPVPTEAPEPRPAPKSTSPKKDAAPRKKTDGVQRVSIAIGAAGYEPSSVTVKAGSPVRLTVGRGEGCAAGFLIDSLGISADNSVRAVTVELPGLDAGRYTFTCGMGMVSGTIVAR